MALAALLHRRTIRQYEPEYRIPTDTLRQIIDAALLSPTGKDVQDIDLVVCTNKAKIDLATTAAMSAWPEDLRQNFMKRVGEYGVKNVVTGDAPCLVLLVKNERAHPSLNQVDAGIMTMSLLVAAKNFGLDSMCLGALLWGQPEKVEQIMGIEKGRMVMAVAIGKAREGAKVAEKRVVCKATFVE